MSGRVVDAVDFAFLDARQICGLIIETGHGSSTNQVPIGTYP